MSNYASLFVVATLLLAACDTEAPSALPVPATLSAPHLPVSTAFSVTNVLTPAASTNASALTVPLPTGPGYRGNAIFPTASVPSNLHLTIDYTNRPPAGAMADPLSTAVVSACFAANDRVNVNGAPQFTFALPRAFATNAVVYSLAIEQNGRWTNGYSGPGTVVAGTTSTIVSVVGRFGFAIAANSTVCVALGGRSVGAPTPVPATAAPSGSPSPVASGSASPVPSGSPSPVASGSASPGPSAAPSTGPSAVPSNAPSAVPSNAPSGSPSNAPSGSPPVFPTSAPPPVHTATPSPTPTPVHTGTPIPTPTPVHTRTPIPTPVPATSLNETFASTSTTPNGWVSGGQACLTAGTGTTPLSSIPACASSPRDAFGSGTLLLTTNAAYSSGFAISKTAIVSARRVSVSFDYFAYDGGGADGLSFFLIDAGVLPPASAGAVGSGLGYANAAGTPGIAHGYLGIGLDSYGNFSVSSIGPNGGTSNRVPNTIAIRGAASTNYEYIGGYRSAGSPASLGINLSSTSVSRPAALQVQVQIDTPQSTITVSINGTTYVSAMPFAVGTQPPFPAKFYFGFAASTGRSTDVHQIRNVVITTS